MGLDDISKDSKSSHDTWIRKWSRSKPGKCYYVNPKTKQSVWTAPVEGIIKDAVNSAGNKEIRPASKIKSNSKCPTETTKNEVHKGSTSQKGCLSNVKVTSAEPEVFLETKSENNCPRNLRKRSAPPIEDARVFNDSGLNSQPSGPSPTRGALPSTNKKFIEEDVLYVKKKRPRNRRKQASSASETSSYSSHITAIPIQPSSVSTVGYQKTIDSGRDLFSCNANPNNTLSNSSGLTKVVSTNRKRLLNDWKINEAVTKEKQTTNPEKKTLCSKASTGPAEARLEALQAALLAEQCNSLNKRVSTSSKDVSNTSTVCSDIVKKRLQKSSFKSLDAIIQTCSQRRSVATYPKVPKKEPVNVGSEAELLPSAKLLPSAELLPSADLQPAARRLAQLQFNLKLNQNLGKVTHSSSVSKDSDLNKSEAMEIEYIESEVLFDIDEMRQKDLGLERGHPTVFMDVDIDCPMSSAFESVLYIVLDTNILLSHLKFVGTLLDSFVPGKGVVHLFLPWQVLQELDHLKDRGKSSIQSLARQAINFLHQKFSEKHPCMHGQKLVDATNSGSCPDDSILQSCLQLKERGCQMILLSNDINLLNKALVCDVEAVTKDQFASQLVKHSQKIHATCQNFQQEAMVKEGKTDFTANKNYTIFCEMKNILEEVLSKIVARGMEDEYKHLWKKRLIKAPPWDAYEVLHCLHQHWLPVCGDFLPMTVQQLISKLQNLLKDNKKGFNITTEDLKESLELSLALLSAVPKKYNEFIMTDVEKIRALISKLCGSQLVSKTEKVSSEELHENRCALVLLCFEDAHNAASNLCSSGPTSDPDWVQKGQSMIQAIANLIDTLQLILAAPAESLNENDPVICGLLSLIKGTSNITSEDLVYFCRQDSNRILLENGIQQFSSFGLLLSNKLEMSSGI